MEKIIIGCKEQKRSSFGSDHHLVMASFRMRIKSTEKINVRRSKKYEIRKLTNLETRKDFKLELKNRFEGTNLIEEQGIEKKWEKIKQTYLQTSEKVLGFRENERKD